ncbi:FYVE and coiled-coil domain-containing protein 1-like isoform X2 [Homarus americanus]|uniref:FYVE and coiled-coil domain-containing protein 1-like isoform X2 n=1 Tax=Homarus americanus TaxID=6706 RepID=UPI001C441155|nr:FYVE and coiled-coil domain-containing protein 1-like isoform X2 [Homarus americanus]
MASNRRPVGINFEKILQSVQNDVREMKIEFEESGLPITDDNKQLHQFCERLEFILKFGLRERNSVLGGKKDLWQYFCKCLADRRNIRDGLKIVKANTELKTGVGRGRCFLRYCLVHQCMGDVLQQCVDNQSVSRHFYQDGALLTDAKLSPTLLNCLYQLCDVPFDLPPTGHDLDVSWPTFSRHGSAGGGWLPPSRAVSLSSLSSYSSQVSEAVSPQLASPPGMAPVGEDEPSQDCLESPQHNTTLVNMEASLEVTSLHDRLALLEDDNATLRASCASLQHKLDQTQQESDVSPPQHAENTAVSQTPDKCVQCEQLSEELRASRAKCSDLQCLQQRMENQVNELQTQVDNLQTQETYLKNEIVSLEKKLKETVSAGDRLTTGVHALLKETDVTAVPKVTVTPERSPALQPTSVILQPDTDSLPPPQQVLDHYQSKLEILEKENQTLREQCLTAEKEKTALRTNIRKVSANWFERKTRVSDSDNESHNSGDGILIRQDSGASREEVGIQVPDSLPDPRLTIKKVEDIPKLLAEVTFATGKLELTERMCCELKRRVRDYETVIDDQEIIIHGLKDQLDTYFNDNQKMSRQLSALTKLFEDLELTEKTRVNAVSPPDNSNTAFNNLPSEEDFKEMSNSVSKTYIKLRELIFEKKSLVTEIERLQVLNVELQRRVTQQETRLLGVSDALHTTWMLVSDMKEQHAQLHTSESILRYELKEKRELLHKLREELECSREQWHKIRQMNTESEEAWNSLREELNERRRMAEHAAESNTAEYHAAEDQGAAAAPCTYSEFEPPVDLLLDMAIEYGVIDADDDTSTSMVAAMEGEDMHASRLEHLEEQCSYLYQKLMASTARSLTLASRLSTLHQHYGSSDEDDDEDEDEEEDYYEEEEELENYTTDHIELEILSPEPESSDTAYMSEADTGSAASGIPGNLSEEEGNTAGGSADEAFSPTEEHSDVDGDLSKRLINFLPRKIEILHRDNKKLEERCSQLIEEKTRVEAQLTEALEAERRLRHQMEEKLEHLGKCVDELKLERNGKISEAEEQLKQKVASLSQREEDYESLQEEIDALKDKYEERGQLLHIATDRVKELEGTLNKSEATATDALSKLKQANTQITEFQTLHSELDNEHKVLKEEMLMVQQQVADLRFQISSKDIEKETAVKDSLEKAKALTAAATEISEQEARISALQQEAATQKQDLLIQHDNLSSEANELRQNLIERDSHCSDLDERVQQAQNSVAETLLQLTTTREASEQLNDDNAQLREKIIQLLSRRVRVCDDCFSVQAELATLIASPAPQSVNNTHDGFVGTSMESGTEVTQTTGLSHPLPIGSQEPDDDDYAIISDDELQSSKLSSSPSSGSPPSASDVITETRATKEILTPDSLCESPPTNAEVWVGAGTRVLVPVDLPVGVILHWNFVSEPKSVSFAVLHQPQVNSHSGSDEEGTASHQRVLIPTTRVASTQGAAVRGRLLTKQPGVYTLVFDNSFSRYTAKKVTYTLRLDNQSNLEGTSPVTTLHPLPTPPEDSLPKP